MKVRFLLDENLAPRLKVVLCLNPQIDMHPTYASKTASTAFGCNLSLNQTIRAGTSFNFTPAFSRFNLSEIANIKLLHAERRT